MNGKTILIIEDEPLLRDVLAKSLECEGFTILKAENGVRGKEVASSRKPDLILLDLILPGEDGFEVLSALSTNPETRNIPVVVLSNIADVGAKERCKQAGVVDYLIKVDYRLDQLGEKIKQICGQYFKS